MHSFTLCPGESKICLVSVCQRVFGGEEALQARLAREKQPTKAAVFFICVFHWDVSESANQSRRREENIE